MCYYYVSTGVAPQIEFWFEVCMFSNWPLWRLVLEMIMKLKEGSKDRILIRLKGKRVRK
jgi:hypothetical protein